MADQSFSQVSTATPVESYSRGNPIFEAELAHRTAAREGSFFPPYLRPGMRVLDLGCGPGSITLGLAEKVALRSDRRHLKPSQIAQAQELSAARGVMNLRFEVADVYRLPFPEGSFDAVFVHVVLTHLREPVRALVAMRRVLCPGAVAGAATLIGVDVSRRHCLSSGSAGVFRPCFASYGGSIDVEQQTLTRGTT
jgi:ubiquinone/menaquinone biosynthesis C-methylase UbiE